MKKTKRYEDHKNDFLVFGKKLEIITSKMLIKNHVALLFTFFRSSSVFYTLMRKESIINDQNDEKSLFPRPYVHHKIRL